MDRWRGKIAVVTGASSGIGASIVKDLLKQGVLVVGLARRVERVEALKNEVPDSVKANLFAVKCDVSKEEEIMRSFAWIESELAPKYGGVHIVINNAGMFRMQTLLDEDNSQGIRDMMDTNLVGLIFATREAVKSMKKHGIDGHVIHINSILGHGTGHHLAAGLPQLLNVYPAIKHGITALTETLRQEMIFAKLNIKVTSISPGHVKTEIIPPEFFDSGLLDNILDPDDVSEAILYVLGTGPRVQVHELIIKPLGEIL